MSPSAFTALERPAQESPRLLPGDWNSSLWCCGTLSPLPGAWHLITMLEIGRPYRCFSVNETARSWVARVLTGSNIQPGWSLREWILLIRPQRNSTAPRGPNSPGQLAPGCWVAPGACPFPPRQEVTSHWCPPTRPIAQVPTQADWPLPTALRAIVAGITSHTFFFSYSSPKKTLMPCLLSPIVNKKN